MSEQSPNPGRGTFLLLATLCLAVSSLYLLSMLVVTDGHFVPQVSDLYLIAQYAKGFADGHPFQYNPGEAPTTGATSLLHTLFLAVAHFVGFRGEGLIAFAILSGGCFAFLASLQAYRAGRVLSGPGRVALLGAVLMVLNGPLAWSFHYGADIALTLFLATWLFAAWLEGDKADGNASTRFVLPACLLALTRPEASVLVLTLGAWSLWNAGAAAKWRERALWMAPTLTALMVPLAFRVLTGSAANTSFSQKLLPANWGFYGAAVLSIDYWSDLLRGVLLGFYPASQRIGLGGGSAPYYAAPFLMLFVFLALLDKSPGMRRASGFLLGALATALLVTPSIQIGVHSNRYLLFALPPLLILFSLGLERAAAGLESGLGVSRIVAFRRLGVIALAFALLSVARFALIYADSASTVYRQDEALFQFIRDRLPENASFLNNGSAIEYSTGRRSVNVSGVVTPEFAGILPAETEAAAFEVLSRPSFGPLPPYLIAFEAYVAGSPGWQALIGGPPLFVTSSLAGSELAVYPTRSNLLGRQRHLVRAELPGDLALVDSLNVTDPIDERTHGYRWNSSLGTRSLFAALKLDRYSGEGRGSGTELADGGRIIMGFEEMSITTPAANSDLWVAVRTNPAPSARVRHPDGDRRMDLALLESTVRFTTPRGRTELMKNALSPGWNEVVFRIPARLLERPATRIRINGRYAGYGYWFFQGATQPGS